MLRKHCAELQMGCGLLRKHCAELQMGCGVLRKHCARLQMGYGLLRKHCALLQVVCFYSGFIRVAGNGLFLKFFSVSGTAGATDRTTQYPL